MTPDPLREQLARLGELAGEPEAVQNLREKSELFTIHYGDCGLPEAGLGCGCTAAEDVALVVYDTDARTAMPRLVACLSELLDLPRQDLPGSVAAFGYGLALDRVRERIARHFPAPEGGGE